MAADRSDLGPRPPPRVEFGETDTGNPIFGPNTVWPMYALVYPEKRGSDQPRLAVNNPAAENGFL